MAGIKLKSQALCLTVVGCSNLSFGVSLVGKSLMLGGTVSMILGILMSVMGGLLLGRVAVKAYYWDEFKESMNRDLAEMKSAHDEVKRFLDHQRMIKELSKWN